MSGEKSFAGMTTNERLFVAGLLDQWDAAASDRDRSRLINILQQVDLGDQAALIADAVLTDPERYGF